MAARQIIENETVLSISKIKTLLNQFFRDDRKPFSNDNFDKWIVRSDAKNRLFGITPTNYRQLNGKPKNKQRKATIKHFGNRYESIFQRRHDCIHNCDRPKIALDNRNLNQAALNKVVWDIEFLANRTQECILAEFPEWLRSLNATGATRGRVLQ